MFVNEVFFSTGIIGPFQKSLQECFRVCIQVFESDLKSKSVLTASFIWTFGLYMPFMSLAELCHNGKNLSSGLDSSG